MRKDSKKNKPKYSSHEWDNIKRKGLLYTCKWVLWYVIGYKQHQTLKNIFHKIIKYWLKNIW